MASKKSHISTPVNDNPVFGMHEENTLVQFHDVMSRAEKGALMADGHLGYVMPIGGVAAYRNRVSPVGVGFDIGCGNMAAKLDLKKDDLDLDHTLDFIEQRISFGIGQTNPDAPRDHPLFDDPEWEAYGDKKLIADLKKLGRDQLGTVGSGNHYVDIFEDESGYVWIGVHFGSRGLGHKTASGFINLSLNRPWDVRTVEHEALLDISTPLGDAYYNAMKLAGKYAWAGREWVCRTVTAGIGAEIIDTVHNNHNFAWKEKHGGEEYIVVRKGATPAFPGQRGFVGGSMGDNSVILSGVDSERSRLALYSTVHGAGRVMSRTKAAGKFKGWGPKRKRISAGAISEKMMHDWLKGKRVKLRGGGLDEAPQAYRRLNEVLGYHADTVDILHVLKPLGVVMAGMDEFDPYKD
ncbi:MAG: RtcB family protein [Rhodothermaceae bacterium]|nr:RtcB family protein [Rhodothermaceae bacterium]